SGIAFRETASREEPCRAVRTSRRALAYQDPLLSRLESGPGRLRQGTLQPPISCDSLLPGDGSRRLRGGRCDRPLPNQALDICSRQRLLPEQPAGEVKTPAAKDRNAVLDGALEPNHLREISDVDPPVRLRLELSAAP